MHVHLGRRRSLPLLFYPGAVRNKTALLPAFTAKTSMTTSKLTSPLTSALLLGVALTPVAPSLSAAQTSAARSDAATITGRVLDKATGDPMANARIVLGGTSLSTSTERDGTFTLRAVPPGTHVLVASYTGFESNSRPVTAQAGQANLRGHV